MAAPIFLPQAQPVYPTSANFAPQLALLGDTIGQSIGHAQRLKLLGDVQNKLASGELDYNRAAAAMAPIDPRIAGVYAQLAPKPNAEIEKLRVLQSNPDLMQTAAALKRAGATSVNVNTGDKSFDTALGKEYADVFSNTQKAGRNAVSRIGTLDVMDKLVDDPNFASGPGAERFQLPLKQAIAKLGGDPNAPASMEAFRALSSKSLLDSLGGSLGAGVSNADKDEIKNQVATLDTSPAGIKAINRTQRLVAQREQEIARFARAYATQNQGRLDMGFDEALAKWAEKNPMFPKSQTQPSNDWKVIAPGVRIRERR